MLVLKSLLTIKCINMHVSNISNVSLNMSPCGKAKVFNTVRGECDVGACEKSLSVCRCLPRASLSHTHTAVHTHVDIAHMHAFRYTQATCRHIHHGPRDQTHLSARYLALEQNPNDVSALAFTLRVQSSSRSCSLSSSQSILHCVSAIPVFMQTDLKLMACETQFEPGYNKLNALI